MSTYQPPGGQQPEPAPGYAQPQDPWAVGPDQELASLPTDPIPQQYGSYPSYQSDVWSQATAAQGGQLGYVPQQPARSNRTGIILLILFAVLALGGGGGVAAWWFATQRSPDPQVSNSASSSPSPSAGSPTEPVAFDPNKVKEGDCIINKGTAKDVVIEFSPCTAAGSYTVIKIAAGADIPENAAGAFDAPVTSVAVCAGTNYESWYGYQDPKSDGGDLFFCMTNN